MMRMLIVIFPLLITASIFVANSQSKQLGIEHFLLLGGWLVWHIQIIMILLSKRNKLRGEIISQARSRSISRKFQRQFESDKPFSDIISSEGVNDSVQRLSISEPIFFTNISEADARIEIEKTNHEISISSILISKKEWTVIEYLREVAGTGEIVEVTYAFGSRPGQPRVLTVVSLENNDEAFLVLEPNYSDTKIYVVKRVMSIKGSDGVIAAKNQDVINNFNAWKANEDAYQANRRRIISTARYGSLADLKRCNLTLVSGSNDSHFISFNSQSKLASISAQGVTGAYRVCNVIDAMVNESEGCWWDMVDILINVKFYWPDWLKYQNALAKEGAVLRGDLSKFSNLNQADSKLPNYTELKRALQSAYQTSQLFPPEDGWNYLDRLCLFELDNFEIDKCLNALSRISYDSEVFKAYFLQIGTINTLKSFPDEQVDQATLEIFKKLNLVTPFCFASIEDLMDRMKRPELCTFAKMLGIKVGRMKKSDLIKNLIEVISPELEGQIRGLSVYQGLYTLNPPHGLTQHELTNFKVVYRTMITTLAAWLSGQYVPSVAKKNFFK